MTRYWLDYNGSSSDGWSVHERRCVHGLQSLSRFSKRDSNKRKISRTPVVSSVIPAPKANAFFPGGMALFLFPSPGKREQTSITKDMGINLVKVVCVWWKFQPGAFRNLMLISFLEISSIPEWNALRRLRIQLLYKELTIPLWGFFYLKWERTSCFNISSWSLGTLFKGSGHYW